MCSRAHTCYSNLGHSYYSRAVTIFALAYIAIGDKQCRGTLFVPYSNIGEIQWGYTVCSLYNYITIGDKQCRGTLNGPYSIEEVFYISVILS